MRYSELYKVRFSPQFNLSTLIGLIRNSPTDWVLLADETYQLLTDQSFDVTFLKAYPRGVFVPQILPYSERINGPFGRKINHVSLQANLKTQPIMVDIRVRPDFIPFAMVINKWTLLRLLKKCDNCVDLFLELSLILADPIYKVEVHPEWIATVRLRDASVANRATITARYFPNGLDYLGVTERVTASPCVKAMVNNEHSCRDGFINLYHILHNKNIILADDNTNEYHRLRYGYTTVAVDPDIEADYYLALPGAMLYEFDMRRTFTQIVVPTHGSMDPIYTPNLIPLGSFAVKQFSSSVNFGPPFSTSSSNLLTALEIMLSCGPKSILVDSNAILCYLVAAEDGAESIKRQTFMTRIIEYAIARDIPLKVFGDLCRLSSPN